MQKRKSQRSLEEGENTYSKDGVTLENFKLAIENGQVCSTIGDLQKHFTAIKRTTNMMKCEVCREKTIWRCVLCDKYTSTTKKHNWNGSR
jgi:hypothetical protein